VSNCEVGMVMMVSGVLSGALFFFIAGLQIPKHKKKSKKRRGS